MVNNYRSKFNMKMDNKVDVTINIYDVNANAKANIKNNTTTRGFKIW